MRNAITKTLKAGILDRGAELSVARPSGKQAYQLLIIPILEEAMFQFPDSPAVVVLICDPAQQRTVSNHSLALVFGLTEAEAKVAGYLVQGMSPVMIANTMGIKVGTVRTHLRAIYKKTGVCGGVEFVVLATQLL